MARTICVIMGVLLGVLGLWGWISGNGILVFHRGPLHNAVHVVSGILALVFAFNSERAARGFCYAFGAVYALVTFFGFIDFEPVVGALRFTEADDGLHLVIAVVFLLAAGVSTATRESVDAIGRPPAISAAHRPHTSPGTGASS